MAWRFAGCPTAEVDLLLPAKLPYAMLHDISPAKFEPPARMTRGTDVVTIAPHNMRIASCAAVTLLPDPVYLLGQQFRGGPSPNVFRTE